MQCTTELLKLMLDELSPKPETAELPLDGRVASSIQTHLCTRCAIDKKSQLELAQDQQGSILPCTDMSPEYRHHCENTYTSFLARLPKEARLL